MLKLEKKLLLFLMLTVLLSRKIGENMTRDEAENYVIANARYMEDSPKTPYFVRFPTPYSGKVFFSAETDDLVDQVFKFGNTVKGKEYWAKIPEGKYKFLSEDDLENVEDD